MAYNPSIHTASNKPYGVTNKPVDARYWYYDSSLYLYRPYTTIAEVLSYLIANDRKGATVQIGKAEYWWPNSSDLSDAGLVVKSTPPYVYNLPANSKTPIVINFNDSTIKFGTDAAIAIGTDLTAFQASQVNIMFKKIDGVDDTITTPYLGVAVLAEQWADNTYQSLVSISLLPETPSGTSGDSGTGLTIENINIIIKV